MKYFKKRCRSLYKTQEEVEEASCIVIQRLISKIDMFDLSKAPVPFVYRAMKNHSIDEFRKKSKRTSIEAAAAKTKTYVSYLGEGTDMLINMYRDDLLKGLEKDIFIATYQHGMKEKEVCAKYKISVTKFKKMINVIKQKFKKELHAR
jgi:RNA polymerase sigma factor (sigma-70 family)